MSDSEEGPYEEDSGREEERGWGEEFEMEVPGRKGGESEEGKVSLGGFFLEREVVFGIEVGAGEYICRI